MPATLLASLASLGNAAQFGERYKKICFADKQGGEGEKKHPCAASICHINITVWGFSLK